MPSDPHFQLQREGLAIHGMVHPNIVRAMGFDPYADPAIWAMEGCLARACGPGVGQVALVDDIVAIMRQILAGLSYAHKKGMIHRDVKPENVLVHERAAREGYALEGVIKVTDFGLGKAVEAAAGSIAYSQSLNSP